MSTARRAMDLLRGYANHGWDFIRGTEETDADRELKEALQEPARLGAPSGFAEPPRQDPPVSLEMARKLYAVPANATSRQINDSYVELTQTIDPQKFPVGSPARDRAMQLRRRIESAKAVLLDNIDPTVRRFEGLEIE